MDDGWPMSRWCRVNDGVIEVFWDDMKALTMTANDEHSWDWVGRLILDSGHWTDVVLHGNVEEMTHVELFANDRASLRAGGQGAGCGCTQSPVWIFDLHVRIMLDMNYGWFDRQSAHLAERHDSASAWLGHFQFVLHASPGQRHRRRSRGLCERGANFEEAAR